MCYVREDSRTLWSGVLFKRKAYRFHQHLEYCVEGNLIKPTPTLYSYYTVYDHIVWTCQFDQENTNHATIPGNVVGAFSSGRCWWSVGIDRVSAKFETRPFIKDTYAVDGSRLARTGSDA